MSRALRNPHLVLHCSAGFSPIEAIEAFWHRPVSQGGLNWNAKGYAVITDLQGENWYLHRNTRGVGGYSKVYTDQCFEFITNGVRGFNDNIVNAAYIGGVERMPNGTFKAKDTRTDKQKAGLLIAMHKYFDWLKRKGGDITKVQIDGHYHYSTDKNRNGIIDPWERIKECPSFDAHIEYRWILQTATNPANRLPRR